MAFKENNFNSPENNNNIEQSKKKENFLKRFMSNPLLQRALLAALLLVASPSDIKKDTVDGNKTSDSMEVLKDEVGQFSQDSLMINDSSDFNHESLSDEEFQKQYKYDGPSTIPDPDPFPVKK